MEQVRPCEFSTDLLGRLRELVRSYCKSIKGTKNCKLSSFGYLKVLPSIAIALWWHIESSVCIDSVGEDTALLVDGASGHLRFSSIRAAELSTPSLIVSPPFLFLVTSLPLSLPLSLFSIYSCPSLPLTISVLFLSPSHHPSIPLTIPLHLSLCLSLT